MNSKDRLIVALDVPGATQARQIVQAIGGAATTYKIGKQLFTAEGPQVVRDLVASGRKVFLDLKYHDIPNTVAAAVRSAAELGVSMLTVHASRGSKMLKAGVEAARQSPAKPMVLAVTVLTSLSDSDLREVGIAGDVLSQVLRLGALARAAGCGGVVASAQEARELRRELGEGLAIVTPGGRPAGPSARGPGGGGGGGVAPAQEARELRRELGEGLAIVTPGVRPAGSSAGDQARVVTPKDAIAAGATYLVVGRPILDAPDPAKAAQQIADEIAAACQEAVR